jgi:hypothetical protein
LPVHRIAAGGDVICAVVGVVEVAGELAEGQASG